MKVTISTIRNAFLSAGVLLLLAPPMGSGQQSEDAVPFDTIVYYRYAGPLVPDTSPVIYIVTDRREWKRVWKLAHLRFFQARPPLPEIDFSSRTVLAVFHEFIGGSCNRSIKKLVVTEEGLEIFVTQTCPNCQVLPANVEKPVQIIETGTLEKRIRKEDPKLVVEFETIPCKPPTAASN